MLDWGGTTQLGWVAVSRVFLRTYAEFGLTPEQAMLVIHILDRQWGEQNPYPKVTTLSSEMKRSEKTIRNNLKVLRDKGLLNTAFRRGRFNEYDFSPLFSRLAERSVEACASPHNTGQPTPDLPRQPPPEIPAPYTRRRRREHEEKNVAPPPGQPPVADALERGKKRTASSRKKQRAATGTSPPSPPEVNESPITAPTSSERPAAPPTGRKGEKAVEDWNCNDMEKAFRHLWTKRWPNTPPKRWTGRERKNAKDFIAEYSAPVMLQVVEMVLSRWKELQRQFGWKGYPNIPLVFGFRGSLVPMALEGDSEPGAPKWGAHWDEEAERPDGAEGGWGDL